MADKKKADGIYLMITFPANLTAGIRDTVTIRRRLLNTTTTADLKRIWDMEQTFNKLTDGRMHISVVGEGTYQDVVNAIQNSKPLETSESRVR